MKYSLLLCCMIPAFVNAQQLPGPGSITREQRDMSMQNFESANFQIDRRHQNMQRREMSGLINPSGAGMNRNDIETRKREELITKMQKNIEKTQADHATIRSFPDTIRSGWHMVNITDHKNFCDSFKVYVSGNRIERFIIDDWYEQPIDFTSDITQGKTILQLQPLDSTPVFPLTAYFNDAVMNPARVTPPPQPAGSIAFWTNMDVEKLGSSILITIDGVQVGRILETVQDGSTPDCKSEFVLNVPFKSGTYKMEAVSKKQKWKQTVTVGENNCRTILLSK